MAFQDLTPAEQQEVLDAEAGIGLPPGGFSSPEVRNVFAARRGQRILTREELVTAEFGVLRDSAEREAEFEIIGDTIDVIETLGGDIPSLAVERATTTAREFLREDGRNGITTAGLGVLLGLGLIAVIFVFR